MKRKLKTLAKLLQEFPEAYFTREGDLVLGLSSGLVIHSGSLIHTGKEVAGLWADCLLEPIEEKPRVAVYLSESRIVHLIEESSQFTTGWTKLGYLKLEDE